MPEGSIKLLVFFFLLFAIAIGGTLIRNWWSSRDASRNRFPGTEDPIQINGSSPTQRSVQASVPSEEEIREATTSAIFRRPRKDSWGFCVFYTPRFDAEGSFICWFDSQSSMYEYIGRYMTWLYPSPVFLNQASVGTQVRDITRGANHRQVSEVIEDLNNILDDYISYASFEWIGTFHSLAYEGSKFPRDFRKQVNGAVRGEWDCEDPIDLNDGNIYDLMVKVSQEFGTYPTPKKEQASVLNEHEIWEATRSAMYRRPRKDSWGFRAYQAPRFVDGDSFVCWFDSRSSMYEFIGKYMTWLYPSPVGLDQASVASQVRGITSGANHRQVSEVIEDLNRILDYFVTFAWIGTLKSFKKHRMVKTPES